MEGGGKVAHVALVSCTACRRPGERRARLCAAEVLRVGSLGVESLALVITGGKTKQS